MFKNRIIAALILLSLSGGVVFAADGEVRAENTEQQKTVYLSLTWSISGKTVKEILAKNDANIAKTTEVLAKLKLKPSRDGIRKNFSISNDLFRSPSDGLLAQSAISSVFRLESKDITVNKIIQDLESVGFTYIICDEYNESGLY